MEKSENVNMDGNNGSNRSQKDGDVYDFNASLNLEDIHKSFQYRTFRCPVCQTEFSVVKEDVGKKFVCPDCDTEITVPDYLDFDSVSDYERQFFDESKLERDRRLSPLRNPNREGIDLNSADVYSVENQGSETASKARQETYYPVRCRVCETLMQAPSYMLGKLIVCPDCGTEMTVTDALKKQIATTEVKFQPRERGIYDIGEVPEAPKIAFQETNGRIVIIDPKEKTVAPSVKLDKKKNVALPGPGELEFNTGAADSKAEALLKAERLLKSEMSSRADNFFKKWSEKRRKRLEEEEDLTKLLPELVLRRKNEAMVWTLPSPPKRLPLFNKTFQAARTEDLWTRAFLFWGVFIPFVYIVVSCLANVLFPEEFYNQKLTASRFVSLLISTVCTPIMVIFGGYCSLFFWSVYNAGNSGAKRVVEWRSEDFLGFLGYFFWAFMLVTASIMPGLLASMGLEHETQGDALILKALLAGSFWLFFPIFWLGSAQANSFFCPMTASLFRSFFSKFLIWIQFYFATLTIVAVPFVVSHIINLNIDVFFVQIALKAIMFTIAVVFYGLLLGRLSWILDDELRSMDFDD